MKFADILASIIHDMKDSLGMVINTLEEVFSSPQVHALKMLQEVEHPEAGTLKVTGIPVSYSETPGEIKYPPPLLGEQTEEILSHYLGYSIQEIDELREQGVV